MNRRARCRLGSEGSLFLRSPEEGGARRARSARTRHRARNPPEARSQARPRPAQTRSPLHASRALLKGLSPLRCNCSHAADATTGAPRRPAGAADGCRRDRPDARTRARPADSRSQVPCIQCQGASSHTGMTWHRMLLACGLWLARAGSVARCAFVISRCFASARCPVLGFACLGACVLLQRQVMCNSAWSCAAVRQQQPPAGRELLHVAGVPSAGTMVSLRGRRRLRRIRRPPPRPLRGLWDVCPDALCA